MSKKAAIKAKSKEQSNQIYLSPQPLALKTIL